MVIYKGGTVVGSGFYWNPMDGQRVNVHEHAILPGDKSRSYLKTSPAGLFVTAPLFGMMYVLFLPLFGIGVFFISCVVPLMGSLAAVAMTSVRVCSRIVGRSLFYNWKSSLLPARHASPLRKTFRRVPVVARVSADSRVLLVDDEMEYVDTLAQRLELRGLKTDVVYNGEQALNFVNDEEPDVMVLDLRMPGMDGMEVLRRIREARLGVQVLILSGKGTEKDKEEARKLGIFDYLKKPIDIDTLMGKIKEACRTRIESITHGYAGITGSLTPQAKDLFRNISIG